ncbi:unnamed protein product [Amoebophrya sp. A120]|nr:unnamed protein product [Amoebophrya sp. A120]|eukprot:GSA120T00001852001.1
MTRLALNLKRDASGVCSEDIWEVTYDGKRVEPHRPVPLLGMPDLLVDFSDEEWRQHVQTFDEISRIECTESMTPHAFQVGCECISLSGHPLSDPFTIKVPGWMMSPVGGKSSSSLTPVKERLLFALREKVCTSVNTDVALALGRKLQPLTSVPMDHALFYHAGRVPLPAMNPRRTTVVFSGHHYGVVSKDEPRNFETSRWYLRSYRLAAFFCPSSMKITHWGLLGYRTNQAGETVVDERRQGVACLPLFSTTKLTSEQGCTSCSVRAAVVDKQIVGRAEGGWAHLHRVQVEHNCEIYVDKIRKHSPSCVPLPLGDSFWATFHTAEEAQCFAAEVEALGKMLAEPDRVATAFQEVNYFTDAEAQESGLISKILDAVCSPLEWDSLCLVLDDDDDVSGAREVEKADDVASLVKQVLASRLESSSTKSFLDPVTFHLGLKLDPASCSEEEDEDESTTDGLN